MTTLSYEKCNEIVRKLVPELIAGTGMELLGLSHTNRVLLVSENADAYELRVGVSEPFTRIVRRIELGAEVCHDEASIMRELASGVDKARAELHGELVRLAARVAPRRPSGMSATYGKCEP